MSDQSEAFEAWLVHPCTEAMMKKAAALSEKCKQKWLAASWNLPREKMKDLDPAILAYWRAKADVFASLSKLQSSDLFKEQDDDDKGSGKKAARQG